MSIFKIFKAIGKLGGKLIDAFEDVADFFDHLIHKKEYERKARNRRIVWTVILSVAGGIIAVLLFPYRIVVKKNGDFEIRTLLIRVFRNTADYDIAEGGTDEFEISGADEVDEDTIEA